MPLFSKLRRYIHKLHFSQMRCYNKYSSDIFDLQHTGADELGGPVYETYDKDRDDHPDPLSFPLRMLIGRSGEGGNAGNGRRQSGDHGLL